MGINSVLSTDRTLNHSVASASWVHPYKGRNAHLHVLSLSLMAVVVAATTWGNPTASKRVLLIHGFTGFSQLWNRLAHDFASRGKLSRIAGSAAFLTRLSLGNTLVISLSHLIYSGTAVQGVARYMLSLHW